MSLFSFFKRKKSLHKKLYDSYYIDYNEKDVVSNFFDSVIFSSVYNLTKSHIADFNFTVYTENVKNNVLTYTFNMHAADIIANLYFLSSVKINKDFIITDAADPFFYHSISLTNAAKILFNSCINFEKLVLDFMKNTRALTFIVPAADTLVNFEENYEELVRLIKNKRDMAGAGAFDVIKANFDIKSVEADLNKIKLNDIKNTLVQLVCNLYNINSLLLTAEQSTYNNFFNSILDINDKIENIVRSVLNIIQLQYLNKFNTDVVIEYEIKKNNYIFRESNLNTLNTLLNAYLKINDDEIKSKIAEKISLIVNDI
jgi:hypothetical protein